MSKFTANLPAHVKSYWHAAIAIETAFLSNYVVTDILKGHAKFDWYTFAYAGGAAIAAPLSRAIVAKWPLLSPLAYRVATKYQLRAPKALPANVTPNFVAPVAPVTPIN